MAYSLYREKKNSHAAVAMCFPSMSLYFRALHNYTTLLNLAS